mmetsp:Transcript_68342/g.177524  ORF Transcript_68342/g.177524 Transcript_68342/m.177524 type:complete len:667 (-) Transcript_68342:83-2083(-)
MGKRGKLLQARVPKRDPLLGVGEFEMSCFVTRRLLAMIYCVAFLSLAAQAEGLFGCSGAFPPMPNDTIAMLADVVPPGVVVAVPALFGAVLAGSLVIAVEFCERYAGFIFALMWGIYFCCVDLAPALYPWREDHLVLEAGLVGVFLLNGSSGTSGAKHAQGIGRFLAAWLLFRASFVCAGERLIGPCDAWRDLTAFQEMQELEPLPLPLPWFFQYAPRLPVQALCGLKLFIQFLLSPLVLAPVSSLSAPAVVLQIFAVLMDSAFANKGSAVLVMLTMASAVLDDSFHGSLWSQGLLQSWGCAVSDREDSGAETEEQTQDASDSNGKVQNDSIGKVKSPPAFWPVLIFFIYAYGALFAAFARTGMTLPKPSWELPVCVAALAVLLALWNFVSAVIAGGCGTQRTVLVFGGWAVWSAGLLLLVVDLQSQGPHFMPASPTLARAAQAAIELHVAHPLHSASEAARCPSKKGRADLMIQGAIGSQETGFSWIELTSHYQPNIKGDSRQKVVQPYTPRLDVELWNLAQNQDVKVLPPWVYRVLHGLTFGEGAAAQLLTHPFGGLASQLHTDPKGPYAKAEKPLHGIRMVWYRRRWENDTHSNSWWSVTDVQVLAQAAPQDLKAYMSRPEMEAMPGCLPAPWLVELPLAEGVLTLIVAALLWKLIVQGSAKN